MTKRVSIFNNKGGVGKTTYMYHIAHLMARKGITVLMVDCDSQCNLTAYSMHYPAIRRSWKEDGNSVYVNIQPVHKTTGDIRNRKPAKLGDEYNLYLVPGDLRLSGFEDLLGDTWNSAKGGSEAALRAQSAIHRYVSYAESTIQADITFFDLGPNLGALNRSVLAASDYFIMPVAPDLFSLQGTKNLGEKLITWRREWDQANESWKTNNIENTSLSVPRGAPKYLGYVVQMHNVRENPSEMTRGWQIYYNLIGPEIQKNIIDKLSSTNQIIQWEDNNYELGKIPNLHSLIPYSMHARMPIFDCGAKQGLKGAHVTKAKGSAEHFDGIVKILEHVLTF